MLCLKLRSAINVLSRETSSGLYCSILLYIALVCYSAPSAQGKKMNKKGTAQLIGRLYLLKHTVTRLRVEHRFNESDMSCQ